jgi:hypothetical protein
VILVPSGFTVDFIVVGGRGAVVVWLLSCDEELLRDDELWLDLLDFAPAGAAASAAGTMAMDNDQTRFVFSIVISPEECQSPKATRSLGRGDIALCL